MWAIPVVRSTKIEYVHYKCKNGNQQWKKKLTEGASEIFQPKGGAEREQAVYRG